MRRCSLINGYLSFATFTCRLSITLDCTGTFVNKRPLAPKTFEQVRPGDVLKFGESQRIYLLTGPEYQRPPELESETLAKVRQALKEKEARREARKKALDLARQGSGDAAAVAAAIAARVSDGCTNIHVYIDTFWNGGCLFLSLSSSFYRDIYHCLYCSFVLSLLFLHNFQFILQENLRSGV